MAAIDPVVALPPRRRGAAGRWLRTVRIGDRIALGAASAVTLLAVVGPLLAPHDPRAAAGPAAQGPSSAFPLGTDEVGRDMLSRVLAGIQTTWLAAIAVIVVGLLVGGAIGLVAGAAGGWIDAVLMRITDVFLALPASVLAIAVVAALGPSLLNTLIAVSLLWWPYYARVVRAEIRGFARRPHMEAARLAGTSRARLLLRHLLPGAIPVAIVAASLDVASLIMLLSGLSFLGLGAQPPAPELGSMTATGLDSLLTSWWIPVMPAAAIFALSLIANVAGDSVRDLVDRP